MTMSDEIVVVKNTADRHGRWYPVGVTYFADESGIYHHDRIVTALKAERDTLLERVELLSVSNFAKTIKHKDGVIADQERDKDRLKAQNERLIRMLAEANLYLGGTDRDAPPEQYNDDEQTWIEQEMTRIRQEIET